MVGDLILCGVSVGTVVSDNPSDYTVYTHYGKKETWTKKDAKLIASYDTILSIFERSILDATGNNSNSE